MIFKENLPVLRIWKRDFQLNQNSLFYQELETAISVKTGRQNSPGLVAKAFPTSRTLATYRHKLEELDQNWHIGTEGLVNRIDYNDFFNLYLESETKIELAPIFTTPKTKECEWLKDFNKRNYNYWYRLKAGERIISDKNLIDRIAVHFPNITDILNCPVCKILANPECNINDLNTQIKSLSQSLGNVVFTIIKNKHIIEYRCFSRYLSFLLFKPHFLAYQLLLLRKRAFVKRKAREISIKTTTLFLLRILLTSHLEKMADKIISMYYIFLDINATNRNQLPTYTSIENLDDIQLFDVFKLFVKEDQLKPYMKSFKEYRNFHEKLLENFRNSVTPKFLKNESNDQILYWIDYHHALWLDTNTDKMNFSDPQTMEHRVLVDHLIRNPNHRIW